MKVDTTKTITLDSSEVARAVSDYLILKGVVSPGEKLDLSFNVKKTTIEVPGLYPQDCDYIDSWDFQGATIKVAPRPEIQIPSIAKSFPRMVPIPKYGTPMTKEDWIESNESGGLLEYDGSGCPATATHMYDNVDCFDRHLWPEATTHVVWFNK